MTVEEAPATGFFSDKVRALLAYLAVECGRPHRRESLAGLLWANYPEPRARASLSQALLGLRKALGGDSPWLAATRETLQLCPTDEWWIDAAQFEALLRAGRSHAHAHPTPCPECAERLERAARLYEGEFLAGYSLDDSPDFEEWLLLRRERYRRQAVECLRALAALGERDDDPRGALAHARRWVELEPLDEAGHRQLMRLLARSGQRSAALAQYEACRGALADDLGIEPEVETTALYEAIRNGTLALPQAEVTAARPELEQPSEPPMPLFVAREQELARLDGWLNEALAGRGRVGWVAGEPPARGGRLEPWSCPTPAPGRSGRAGGPAPRGTRSDRHTASQGDRARMRSGLGRWR
ncbi:MAG: hypothetical protein JXA74_17030 [Anaerolineae bacterium]|nr:hypothetical protein [Anaerolineae bacterium]